MIDARDLVELPVKHYPPRFPLDERLATLVLHGSVETLIEQISSPVRLPIPTFAPKLRPLKIFSMSADQPAEVFEVVPPHLFDWSKGIIDPEVGQRALFNAMSHFGFDQHEGAIVSDEYDKEDARVKRERMEFHSPDWPELVIIRDRQYFREGEEGGITRVDWFLADRAPKFRIDMLGVGRNLKWVLTP